MKSHGSFKKFYSPLFPVWQKVQPGTRNVLISVKCLNPSNQDGCRKKVLGFSICSRDKVSAAIVPINQISICNQIFHLRTGRTKHLNCRAGGHIVILLHTEFQNKRSTFSYEALQVTRQYEKGWNRLDWPSVTQEGIDEDMNHLLGGWLVSKYRSCMPWDQQWAKRLDREKGQKTRGQPNSQGRNVSQKRE